jgi:5'-nucleotidase / UDP-sugar diphosphatase
MQKPKHARRNAVNAALTAFTPFSNEPLKVRTHFVSIFFMRGENVSSDPCTHTTRRETMNVARPALTAVCLLAGTAAVQAQDYSLTILHNNDGESSLSATAEFATLMNRTRNFYRGAGHGVVSIFGGDSIIPSPEFQASLDSGPAGSRTFFDALALDNIGYDAAAVGNHEFDAGPDVFAEFLQQTSVPFVSANLDFTGEASLSALMLTDLFSSTMVDVSTAVGTKKIGIVGATTENLPFITSTGNVVVNDVVSSVDMEARALKSGGADHIILASHLQGISEDRAVADQLASLGTPIDLIVAGGGDEILADLNADSPLTAIPGAPESVVDTGLLAGDTANIDQFPDTMASIPIVTGAGDYGYLGRVTLNFDAAGNFLGIDPTSNPIINQGFTPDPTTQAQVVDPVDAFVADLANNILAQSSETLLGNGDRDVIRAKEAGLGNLVADGILNAGIENAGEFDAATPDLAFVNGGGIRDDINPGDISQLTTFDISPFGNIVSIVEDVKAEDLKLIFENAYSRTTDDPTQAGINPIRDNVGGTGRFLHVSQGVEIVYDIFGTALELDNNGEIVTEGSRILDIVINGVEVVKDGEVVTSETFDIATLDFLLGGGDQIFESYLSQDYAFTRLGVSDQNALQAYLEQLAAGDTTFDIASIEPYSANPMSEARITAIPEPGTLVLMGLGALAMLYRDRRKA